MALITLAACGSSAARTDRSSKVDITTWRAGTESGTAKIAGRSTTVTDGKPDQVEVTEGAVDFDRRLYASKTRIVSEPNAGREFETRQIGDTMYWWDPSPEGPGGTAKPWSRSEVPWRAGAWRTTLDRAFTDPDATVTRSGTETVRGAEVTNYRIDYPPHVPPRLLARGYPTGFTDLEIAVDGDQRVRRVRYSANTWGTVVTRGELELYDYGAPVTVDAPSDDEIDRSVTGGDRPVATGPWAELATDGNGADRIVVSAVPTRDGACFRFDGTPARQEWWTVGGRATDNCMSPGDLGSGAAEVNLYPVGTDLQILTGQFDPGTTAVSLRLDDGSELTAAPNQGAFAVIVRGNRVVERVEATGPHSTGTCEFDPQDSPSVYNCSSSFGGDLPPDVAVMIPPEFAPPATPATPTTVPGG